MHTNRDQKSKDIAAAAVEILGIAEMFSPTITEETARRAIRLGCMSAAREGLPVQQGLNAATGFVNAAKEQHPGLTPGRLIVRARAMARKEVSS